MRDQGSSTAPAGRLSGEVQFMVLALLLDPECRMPWSVEELAREVSCELTAADAVVRLHAAGLVHRVHELVFPTRAASRFCQLLRE
jgi:predicted transcriptional regulator